MSEFTKDEKSKILIELQKRGKIFSFSRLIEVNGKLVSVGHGASADVYMVNTRVGKEQKYVLKVIGFNGINDSERFREQVDAQTFLGFDVRNRYTVKIQDSREIYVKLSGDNSILEVKERISEENRVEYLKLQFVLMEKCEPVIYSANGKVHIGPTGLKKLTEREVIKLGLDIARGLKYIHNQSIIHRDIKLENVYYSYVDGTYKLGDFGIAKKTVGGIANTISGTRGYCAPEVLQREEKYYDYTADIYSLGMMMFLLLNDFCFPMSDGYRVNEAVQYSEDFVLPKPKHCSDELYDLLVSMCLYQPEIRMQSIDTIIDYLSALYYEPSDYGKILHRNSYFIAGTVLLILGIGIFILSTGHTYIPRGLNIWWFVGMLLSCWCGYRCFRGENYKTVNGCIALATIAWLIFDGISWGRFGIAFLIFVLVESGAGILAMYYGMGVFSCIAFSILYMKNIIDISLVGYEWLGRAFIIIGVQLLIEHLFYTDMLGIGHEEWHQYKLKVIGGIYFFVANIGLLLSIFGRITEGEGDVIQNPFFLDCIKIAENICFEGHKAVAFCIMFWCIWYIRERIAFFLDVNFD